MSDALTDTLHPTGRPMADLCGPGYPVSWNHADSRVRGDRWLRTILGSDLTPGCKVLATAIVRLHFNWTTGQCNPSQDTLAAETNQCSRSVEKQLELLRKAGFLAWRKSFQSSNRYWLLITPNCGRELSTEPAAGIDDYQSRTPGPPAPHSERDQSRTSGGKNPFSNPLKSNPKDSAPCAEDFGLFFEAFPKKEQAKTAAKEYAAALAKGATDADLLDGARRYAAHITATGKELRFVKLAKTWLADEGWRDDYGNTAEIKPRAVDTETLRAEWGGAAGKLIDALGVTGPALFAAWFKDARFEDGAPPRICVPKEFKRVYIASKFARPLRMAFGEIVLEVAA